MLSAPSNAAYHARRAGIGAIVGAVGGSLYGLNEENRRTEAARAAYADCMARRGY